MLILSVPVFPLLALAMRLEDGGSIFYPKDVTPRRKFRYDLLYIREQSFWLDVRLIVLSFLISFRGKWETRGKKT